MPFAIVDTTASRKTRRERRKLGAQNGEIPIRPPPSYRLSQMEHFEEHSAPLSTISTAVQTDPGHAVSDVPLADHDIISALQDLTKKEPMHFTQPVGSNNSSSAELEQAISSDCEQPARHKESQPIDRTPLLRNTRSSQLYHIFGSEGEQLIEVVDDYGGGQEPVEYAKTYDPFNAGPNLRPYAYPPDYICFKCRNTGIVIHTDKPCKRCFRKFSPQSVKYKSRLVNLASRLLPRSAMWIDTGGGYCSRCRGSGEMKHWTGRTGTCSVCDGCGIWP